jgi:hypothetical protein
VRDLLIKTFSLHQDDVRSTSMGAPGEDVQLSNTARKFFPFQIECKSLAKIAVYNYVSQAKQHGSHEPVVFIKQNHSKPLVVVDAEVFVNLVKKANENGKP